MTEKERAKYKRCLKDGFAPLVRYPMETLIDYREGMDDLCTEYDTPARLGKLMILFGAVTRSLCESRRLDSYPIKSYKKEYFKVATYDYINSIEDEQEAIEYVVLLAVTVTADILGID